MAIVARPASVAHSGSPAKGALQLVLILNGISPFRTSLNRSHKAMKSYFTGESWTIHAATLLCSSTRVMQRSVR